MAKALSEALTEVCKYCQTTDVMQSYGRGVHDQGICPFCGEICCPECTKKYKQNRNKGKCVHCKSSLMASDKKVFKALDNLRVKYLKLKNSRLLTEKEKLTFGLVLISLSGRFATGNGTPKNEHLSRKMCRELMELKNPVGYYNLYHLIVESNPEEALELIRTSAEMGFVKAKLILAMEILSRNNKRHTKESEELLKQAALTGLPEAEYQLGIAYHLGILPGESPDNVESNQKRALFWYLRAAKQNHPSSINNIGVFYKEGAGCIGNTDKALEYFNLSMSLGCKEGGYGAGMIYEEAKDYKVAAHYYSQAALMDYAPAMFRLGLLIISEKIPNNAEVDSMVEGLRMIRDAAVHGYQDAQEYLEKVVLDVEAKAE